MTSADSDSSALDRYIAGELPKLIRLVTESDVRELDLKAGEIGVLLRRAVPPEHHDSPGMTDGRLDASGDGAVAPPDQQPHIGVISAPIVGIFYHSEQRGRAAMVSEGSHVEPGSLVGVVEALQVSTDVESDCRGAVLRIVADDGKPVEYGQPLIEVLIDE